MSSNNCRWRLLLVGVFLVCITGASIRAGTIHLSAAGPSTSLLNVLTNEPIIWVADDAGPYTVTSYDDLWTPIYLAHQGSTGSVTLKISGNYTYYDGIGNSGLIYVNIPPSVQITSPTNGAVFTAPASFDFNVNATDTDQDHLLGVDFWLDSTYLGGVSRFDPMTMPVSNLGPGTHVLTAIAVDYGEASATNSVTITVQAAAGGPITLGAPTLNAGNLLFNATGTSAGKSNILQSAISLVPPVNWLPVSTNVAAGNSMSFTNPVVAGAQFFRTVQLP